MFARPNLGTNLLSKRSSEVVASICLYPTGTERGPTTRPRVDAERWLGPAPRSLEGAGSWTTPLLAASCAARRRGGPVDRYRFRPESVASAALLWMRDRSCHLP